MTVSYLPLIKVQQKRHGFTVHDRDFTSSVDLLAAGKAARARLMGVVTAPEPEPASLHMAALPPIPQAVPDVEVIDPSTPLNMLAPCSGKFLLAVVALRHGISPQEIIGGKRERRYVAARTEAMCLIYQHTQWSLPQVGRFLKRDHTTVLHALQKHGVVRKKVELEPHLAAALRPGRSGRDMIILGRTPGFPSVPAATAQEIIQQVCEKHSVSELELRSARRANRMVFARHEAMYRLANELALSNPQIGKALGGKHPSMIPMGIRAHEARLSAGVQQ